MVDHHQIIREYTVVSNAMESLVVTDNGARYELTKKDLFDVTKPVVLHSVICYGS